MCWISPLLSKDNDKLTNIGRVFVNCLIAMTSYVTRVAKGKRGVFGSRLEGVVHRGEEGVEPNHEAAGHVALKVKTQRAVNVGTEPAFIHLFRIEPQLVSGASSYSVNPV